MMQPTLLDTGWEFYRGTLGGPADVWRPDAADDVAWKPVRLPHCCNAYDTVDPDRSWYRGEVWYRIRIGEGAVAGDGRTLLQFDGGGPEAAVFIGDEPAGAFRSCGEAADIDITGACRRYRDRGADLQGIPLAVRCDNRRSGSALPPDRSGICRSGGLFRQVRLVRQPEVALRDMHIRCRQGGDGAMEVTVAARLYNPGNRAARLSFELSVTGPDGSTVRSRRFKREAWPGSGELDSFVITEPVWWSPGSPSLYTCSVQVAGPGGRSGLSERFGIRSAVFAAGGGFLLNGERMLLRGVHWYDDAAGQGAALTADEYGRRLNAVKGCGANFVRFAGSVPGRAALKLCDELGLLAWVGIPWDGSLAPEPEVFRTLAHNSLEALITQLRNHPSVLLWGICDGYGTAGADAPADVSLIKELHALAGELDPGRLTGSIHCPAAEGITGLHVPRLLVPGGDPHGFRQLVTDTVRGAGPVLAAELLPANLAGFHDDPAGDGKNRDTPQRPTETAFCHQLEHQLNILEHIPDLAGYMAAVFNDYAAPRFRTAALPCVQAAGLVTREGEPKAGYHLLRSAWTAKPMVHLYGQGLEVRTGRAGAVREVRVYSNCPDVALFLNGALLESRKRNPGDFPAAGLRWAVPFKKGKNVLEAVGRDGDREVRDRQEVEYLTERWGSPRKFRLKVKRFRHGRRLITARALDQRGNVCPDAELMVRFSIAGTGALLDNRGTMQGSRVVLMTGGTARIWAVGNHGFSTVAVTAEGMRTVFKRMR